ncbi:MAG: hypothetical protein ACFFB3_14375 [Candidatus Hodarchaeota archaeon]
MYIWAIFVYLGFVIIIWGNLKYFELESGWQDQVDLNRRGGTWATYAGVLLATSGVLLLLYLLFSDWGNPQSKKMMVAFICSGIFLFGIVVLPLLRFPFMTGEIQCRSGQFQCGSIPFYYNKWWPDERYFYAERLSYADVNDTEVPWAWAILDFWYWVMFTLAIWGALLILIRQSRLKEGLSGPSWISGFGWAMATFGVVVEWGLFLIITNTQSALFGAEQVSLGQFELNYSLSIVHIACLLVLLLGAFPERAWRALAGSKQPAAN